jgi:tripartite-type tricarboxylate transporter receptor subunit TctC
MRNLLKAACLALLVALPAPALAQKFPERTVRIIVPFAAGGGVDSIARLLAEKLQVRFGVPVIVENRAGANGTLGGQHVVQSAPDGHTILFSASTAVGARLVMSKAPYDPLTDFSYIARMGEAPMLIVMAPDRPQKTLAEAITEARKSPDKWTAATAALGSPGHLAMIALSNAASFKPTIVPYRGTAPALNDIAGGHVQLYIDAMVALLPMAQSGKIKALAVTTARRTALAPDLPTAAESGVPGFDARSWYGFWGPKALPKEIITRLNAEIAAATRELAQDGKLATLGVEPVVETPEQFAKFAADEVAKNAELLKSVNFQPE